MGVADSWLAFSLGAPEILTLLVPLLCVLTLLWLLMRFLRKSGGKASTNRGSELSKETDESLRRLAQLRQDGVLTEEEFAAKKRELLSGGR